MIMLQCSKYHSDLVLEGFKSFLLNKPPLVWWYLKETIKKSQILRLKLV